MGDNQGCDPLTEISKEIVKQAYPDAGKPITEELGKLGAAVIQLIRVPVEKFRDGAFWQGKQIENFWLDNVTPKLAYTVKEKIVEPDSHIAIPALIALSYTHEQEELREMYANLLANAMDSDTKDNVHPSFIEVIKQLTPKEAQLLSMLDERQDWKTPTICTSKITKTPSMQTNRSSYGGGGGYATNHILDEFVKSCEGSVSKVVAMTALDNFRRLRLMDVALNVHQNLVTRNNAFEMKTDYTEYLFWTPYGQVFLQMCVKSKGGDGV